MAKRIRKVFHLRWSLIVKCFFFLLFELCVCLLHLQLQFIPAQLFESYFSFYFFFSLSLFLPWVEANHSLDFTERNVSNRNRIHAKHSVFFSFYDVKVKHTRYFNRNSMRWRRRWRRRWSFNMKMETLIAFQLTLRNVINMMMPSNETKRTWVFWAFDDSLNI